MKIYLTETFLALVATTLIGSTAFAGQVFNEQVSGETCEMIDVMSDLTPGKVLYSYRADPTCGNVRTSKSWRLAAVGIFDKAGNLIDTRSVRVGTGEEDNGG